MSGALPKEKQTAYQRWEMASFGDSRPSAAARQTPSVPALAEQLAAAREEARSAGYAAGLAEGRAQGLKEGLEEGRAHALQEKRRMQQLATAFSSEIANANELIAGNLLDLALDLAKAMLKTALEVKPELMLPVVEEAVRYLPALQQPALLYLHPEDAALVKSMMGDELVVAGWRIVEEQMERGGCRVETASNQIDAGMSIRWQRLVAALGKNTEWLA